jgi:DNA-binding response OmpR family regulator
VGLKGIIVHRKQVLHADNDRNYLDARSEFLELEGYQVLKAYSPEEAERIFERENVHLAILDIRLVNDNDEEDISGILLAKDERFKRVPKIFVTGFPTFEAVREAYGPVIGGESIAHAFLAKKEGPKALLEVVNSAYEKVVGINWKLKIVWDEMGLLSFPYLTLLLESDLDPTLLISRSSELEDLFRKLFFTDEQISVVRLNWLRDGRACLTLFAMKEGSSRQAIAIFGHWDVVFDQFKLAEKYLVKGSALFSQPAFAETLRYAGFVYTIPDAGGGPLQTGPTFFQEAVDKNIRAALENLYKQVLPSWQKQERSELSEADLAAIYCDRLGIPVQPESIEKAQYKALALFDSARSYSLVKEISIEGREIVFVFTNGQIYRGPDPLAALFDPLAFDKQPTVIAPTFGGIAASSLLIDQEGRVYPTDVSTITQSPILEDFVSIETEFHFNKIGSLNLYTLWDFEKQLGEFKTLNDQLPAGNVEPECRKVLVAIQTIRKLAAEIAGEALEPYLIGLFHYTLKALLPYDPLIHLAKYQAAQLVHRLMAASMIIAQIKRLSEDEKSSRADPGAEEGLQINEASRKVSVDGRELRLTQTEFKLLLYLYQNPNRLCSREEILSQVFEIKGGGTKSDKGLLNTHIDRLRKKIDFSSAKHRYIVTIRGEGYLLDLKP